MLFLSSLLIFAALTLMFLWLASVVRRSAPRVDLQQEFKSIRKPAVFGPLTEPLSNLIPHTKTKKLEIEKSLVASGQFEFNALSNFLARRNVLVIVCVLTSAALFAFGIFDGFELIASTVFTTICVFAYAIPSLYVAGKASRRLQKIEKNLPDALDLIALSVGGGLTLNRSFDSVTGQLQSSHPELAKEFQIISRQAKSGSIDQAFSSFAQRMQLPEVTALCSLMRQNQRLGVKMVEALTDFSNRIRDDRKRRAEQIGNTATIKLLVPVVTCLAPPVFILLIGPAVLDLREFITRERGIEPSAIREANDAPRPVIIEEGNSRQRPISPDRQGDSPVVSSFGLKLEQPESKTFKHIWV